MVGRDFPPDFRDLLARSSVDLSGLEIVDGKTFRWGGRYSADMNVRETLFVDLNVVADLNPSVPDAAAVDAHVFLGNTDPGIQSRILDEVRGSAIRGDRLDGFLDS